MAVAATNLTTARSNINLAAYVTAAVTPTANRLLLATIHNQASSGTPNTPTLTGNGLTWVEVATTQTSTRRETMFRAMGAAPTLGVITIDFALQTQSGCDWNITELPGSDTGGTDGSAAIVQSAVASSAGATSLTITLAPFADAGNATFAVFDHAANEDTTEGSGFSRVGETHGGSPNSGLLAEFRADNDTSVDASWVTSVACRGIAVEIKAATGGAAQALAGTSAGSSSDTGAVSVDRPLAGSSTGTSTDTGALAVDRPLAGQSDGASADTGEVTILRPLAGVSAGSSADTGALTVAMALAGVSAGLSTDTAALRVAWALAGVSAGTSLDTGELSGIRAGFTYGGDDDPTATYGGAGAFMYGGDDDPTTTYGG